MIHEPECWIPSTMDEFYAENGGCYVCQTIRAAYQRGREDAAKRVEAVLSLTAASEYDGLVEYAVVAARGESADEDKPECWDCESCSDPDCGCIGCGVVRVDGAE